MDGRWGVLGYRLLNTPLEAGDELWDQTLAVLVTFYMEERVIRKPLMKTLI